MKRIFCLLLVLTMVLNFGMAIPVSAEPTGHQFEQIYIKAGPINADNWQYEVGSMDIYQDGDSLFVDVDTYRDWRFLEVHIAWGDDFSDIPHTQQQNNPIPGQFPINEDYPFGAGSLSFELPGGHIGTIIVFHCVVGQVQGDGFVNVQTAWGDCNLYPSQKWAKWLRYVGHD